MDASVNPRGVTGTEIAHGLIPLSHLGTRILIGVHILKEMAPSQRQSLQLRRDHHMGKRDKEAANGIINLIAPKTHMA